MVGAVLLLYSETMQEARTIFAGVPSMGDEPKGKVSPSWPQMTPAPYLTMWPESNDNF